jgi:phosphatidate phosphatase APP1
VISSFPTYARRTPDGRWKVHIAGMVVRPLPATSRRRNVAIAVLKRVLELDPDDVQAPLFQKRATAFFFQRVAGQPVDVWLDGRRHAAGATDRVGHFTATLDLDDRTMDRLRGTKADGRGASIDCRVEERATDRDEHGDDAAPSSAEGRIHVVEPEGFSIVSDIDDTVKDSNVVDKRELLANTFVREFRPISDMVEAFRRFEREGTAFHYVSASPWQLAGCLGEFFAQAGLPGGSMHLKLFRLKDSTPLGRFPSRKRSKRRAVERILADFPKRRFLLVGDSGELDPEVYVSVARRHPEQIDGIAIRLVQEGDARIAVRHRIEKLARKLPPGLLETFTLADDAFPPQGCNHTGLSNAF